MFTEKFKKLNRSRVLTLLVVLFSVTILMVGCVGDEIEEGLPCETHSFLRIEDAGNRAPTYDVEGRELRACTECGVSAYFVIPKLERLPASEEEGYMPLLSSYTVTYGDTLEDVKGKFFTAGWDFALDKETKVGASSEEGYDFKVIYTPKEDKYAVEEVTIRLIVKKAKLTEKDITLINPLNIPSSVSSLEEMPLTLSDNPAVKGSIAWVEGQEILRNQSSYYDYIFIPEDSENYEIYVGKLLLNA